MKKRKQIGRLKLLILAYLIEKLIEGQNARMTNTDKFELEKALSIIYKFIKR